MSAGLRSAASFFTALAAAVLIWQSRTHPKYLFIAAVLLLAHLWLSQRGGIIQDLANRFADILVIAGVAESGWCNTILGYWTAIGVLLVAHVHLYGDTMGVPRDHGGWRIMPWRLVLLSIAVVTTSVLVHLDRPFWFGGWAVLDWTHFVILIGCAETIAGRIARILRARAA